MASFTPRLWICCSTFWVAPVSSRKTLSVTSSSSRLGSSPAWVSAETRVTMKPGSRSWRGLTRLVEADVVAGPGLRPIEREIGIADQFLDTVAVTRAEGDADRGADEQALFAVEERPLQRADHGEAELFQLLAALRLGHH